MFSLAGVDATVSVDGKTVTIKYKSAGKAEQPITLTADKILGAAVWTGLLTGQFSVHYTDGSATNQYRSVEFRVADKEWWDAMASAVIKAVARAQPKTRSRTADKAPADAPPSFNNWLSRTVGYEAQQQPAPGP